MRRSLLLLIFAQKVLFVQSMLLEDILNVAWCLTRCNAAESCSERCDETRNNVTNIAYTDGPSEANVSIHCKGANRLVLRHNPGIYVIEMKSKDEDAWMHPTIRKDDFWVFGDLLAGREYQYRVRKVTSAGVALPDVTEWFKTEEESFVPKEVKELYISGMDLTENKMETYLNIVPADDLNCIYDIIHLGDEHKLYQYQLDASQEYRIKLRHLEYNKHNTIYVISRNEKGLKQSNNVSLTFETPSCLSVYGDLRICAPAPVTGLQMFSTKFSKRGTNLNVSWDEPELEPNNFTVIIQPLDCENRSVEITFPGNQTSAEIYGVALSRQYKVAVIAESEGGSSLKWQIFKGIEGNSFDSKVLIAASALAILAIFSTIAFVYYRYKRFRVQSSHYCFFKDINRKNPTFEDVKRPLKSSYEQVEENSKLKKDKFEIDSNRLCIKRILGCGISGVVKLATFQDNEKRTIDVAVKMLREDASPEDVNNFHREILLMKSAGNHPNIVSLIGCCSFNRNPLLIVEYCSKGDLLSYLRRILEDTMQDIVKQVEHLNNPELGLYFSQDERDMFRNTINNRLYEVQVENLMENKLTAKDLLGFAKQVATGMEFLSLNRIVHRDLAARNVLVCADNTVKISDFGLSRDIYQENVYKKEGDGKLPIKWMALEALTHQFYTSQSDVWSFGILLYEIVTLGGNPYPGMQSSEILHLLKSGSRMERPSNCGFHLYEIMRSCWHENPSSRPTFSYLRHQFDKLLTPITSNQYLNLIELLKQTP